MICHCAKCICYRLKNKKKGYCHCGCGRKLQSKNTAFVAYHHLKVLWATKRYGDKLRKSRKTKEFRQKISEINTGRVRSKAFKDNLSLKNKGKIIPEWHKQAIAKKNSKHMLEAYANGTRIANPHPWYLQEYNGISMRSSYEVAFAKFLDKYRIKWRYECRVFDLKTTTYRPDFYLPKSKIYIEVKGWISKDFKKKLKKFFKLYPKIRLYVLRSKELQKLGVGKFMTKSARNMLRFNALQNKE